MESRVPFPPQPIPALALRAASTLRAMLPRPHPTVRPTSLCALSSSSPSRSCLSSNPTPSSSSTSSSPAAGSDASASARRGGQSPMLCDAAAASGAPCHWALALLHAVLLPAAAHARGAADGARDALIRELQAPQAPQKEGHPSPTVHPPAADRVVAIGDVHGDVSALRGALRAARVIDGEDAWIGGRTVLVQVGDQLDRGGRERDIYDLLFALQDGAPRAGGAVHILLGNHELMNARLDFRYVTEGGYLDFERDGGWKTVFGKPFASRSSRVDNRAIRALPERMRARARSIVAGGPLAVELAQRAKISVIVGDSLFVHGGINTRHICPPTGSERGTGNSSIGGGDAAEPADAIDFLRALNAQTRAFLLGKADYPPALKGANSPVWMRDYSRPGVRAGGAECRMLDETLRLVGVKRMVVGHTPQAEGINAACGGRVWRIDTGMSKAYGGTPEAIEISRRGNVKIYTQKGVVQGSARFK